MKAFAILISLTLATLPIAAQNPPHPREIAWDTVSVTGEGLIMSPPDEVMFTAGVQTASPSVDEAVRENNERTRRVIDALKRAGATDAEIRTSNFSIWPQQDYQQGRTPRITGFLVSNQVTVTKKDPAAASRLLTAAVEAGANNVSGLSMSVSNLAEARREGLRRAFADARARAEALAQAAGRSLGPARVIQEGGAATPPPMPYGRAMAMEARASVDVPVEPGSSELRFIVNVTFELR